MIKCLGSVQCGQNRKLNKSKAHKLQRILRVFLGGFPGWRKREVCLGPRSFFLWSYRNPQFDDVVTGNWPFGVNCMFYIVLWREKWRATYTKFSFQWRVRHVQPSIWWYPINGNLNIVTSTNVHKVTRLFRWQGGRLINRIANFWPMGKSEKITIHRSSPPYISLIIPI